MSGSEIIGDLAQGALLAQAIEPPHGEAQANSAIAADGHTHESACLNCGTTLIGSHCHNCGQMAHVHRTLMAIFHDLVHGLYHFEGKVWRTLPMLAWHPGRLTREYIAGRRASYVSPIALFLFVIFLTFAVFSAINGEPHIAGKLDEVRQTKIKEGLSELQRKITVAEIARVKAVTDHQPTDKIDGQLVSMRAGQKALQTALNTSDAPNSTAETQKKSSILEINTDNLEDKNAAHWLRRIDQAWQAAAKNPDLALFKLQANAHKFSWLLIPLSVPFVWLLFPFNRRYRLYDHTVFVTYSISFMCLILLSISLTSKFIGGTANGAVPGVLALYAVFHLYRQLKEAYSLSRRAALLRTALLSFFALIVIVVWLVLLLGLLLTG